jgi:methanogenic corrinoid protein MtbC1
MIAKAEDLISPIAALDDVRALRLAKDILESGVPGQDVLRNSLEGLKLVGNNYEEGSCYLSGLVMGGWIMRSIIDLIRQISPIPSGGGAAGPSGVVVLGTIEGDIHDLGKDLVGEVLQSHGFEVHDLGVDVASEQFLAQAIQLQPDLVAISILVNTCYPALARAVSQLKTMIPAGFKRPGVMIGGRAVDQAVFDHVKADLWSRDIMGVADQCRQWLGSNGPRTAPKPPPDLTG